jgi:hypothetical protein
LYGTLEFISNVPYYGIFIINPYGVRFCIISLLLLLFMLTVCAVVLNKLSIEQTVCSPHGMQSLGMPSKLPHSTTGALLRSMPSRFTSLHYRSPAEKHMSESCCLIYAGH